MKYIFGIIILSLISAGNICAKEDDAPLQLDSYEKKLSYVLGLDLGNYFKNLDEPFDLNLIQRGVEDSYNGNKPIIPIEEATKIQQQFNTQQQKKRVSKTLQMTAKNREKAESFLKENKSKKGITTTPSGLQYRIITHAEGTKPTLKDTVKVHYKGTLLNGKEFDSSNKQNQPAVFKLEQVIPGWSEALQLMSPGSVYELFVKPDLAYGDRGVPPVIEPGSLLVFEVNLLEIQNEVKKTQ